MTQEKIHIKDLNLYYGTNHALKNVSIDIKGNRITSLIGPSGCGKSTFLRTLNRLNDTIDNVIIQGDINIDGQNIYDKNVDVVSLRKKVGMIFQKSNPFPKSVFENVAYGPRINGMKKKSELEEIVERSCRRAAIWDEVKVRLNDSAIGLSGGQQQRLCIARTIAVKPKVILMDEPCSALDPVATLSVEDLMRRLAEEYTIVIDTHNMQQAARVSDNCAFFLMGEIIEYSATARMFTKPENEKTQNYISGRFG